MARCLASGKICVQRLLWVSSAVLHACVGNDYCSCCYHLSMRICAVILMIVIIVVVILLLLLLFLHVLLTTTTTTTTSEVLTDILNPKA